MNQPLMTNFYTKLFLNVIDFTTTHDDFLTSQCSFDQFYFLQISRVY